MEADNRIFQEDIEKILREIRGVDLNFHLKWMFLADNIQNLERALLRAGSDEGKRLLNNAHFNLFFHACKKVVGSVENLNGSNLNGSK